MGLMLIFAPRQAKCGYVAFGSMLSKKSKIERLRKSREDQFFVVSAAASLCRACTKVCDRSCVIRCGPSRCPAWDAPAALKNFVRQPEKTFSTASVKVRRTQPEQISSGLPLKDEVIGRPSLWIAEDCWVLRFRLMVKRGPWRRPQASEGEAQHGPFCWIGRIGQGDQHLHCG